MIEVECQISIKKNGNCFLAPLRIELLHEISKNGSLSSAAKKLNISYQHAWNMIEEMNRNAPSPLVIKQRGGVNGGGAEISTFGLKMIDEYKQIELQVKKLVNQINVEINI